MEKKSFFNNKVLVNISIGLLLVLFIFVMIAALNLGAVNDEEIVDLFEIHFIDVGQANATLLIGPDFTILVDAGHYRRNDVESYLHGLGIKEIDLLVGTHPHADHIGQFDKVLDNFHVEEVWMSGDIHTTKTFERAIDAISRSNTNYYEPRTGEEFHVGSLEIKVLHPDILTGDFHEGCIALRVRYKDFSLLLTGDIERAIEYKIIDGVQDLSSTILELGHHGSRTSSSFEFLETVAPEIAIYSAGVDNDYGHPHKEVLSRLDDMGIPVYGTDIYGTIIIRTDGYSYELYFENE